MATNYALQPANRSCNRPRRWPSGWRNQTWLKDVSSYSAYSASRRVQVQQNARGKCIILYIYFTCAMTIAHSVLSTVLYLAIVILKRWTCPSHGCSPCTKLYKSEPCLGEIAIWQIAYRSTVITHIRNYKTTFDGGQTHHVDFVASFWIFQSKYHLSFRTSGAQWHIG